MRLINTYSHVVATKSIRPSAWFLPYRMYFALHTQTLYVLQMTTNCRHAKSTRRFFFVFTKYVSIAKFGIDVKSSFG